MAGILYISVNSVFLKRLLLIIPFLSCVAVLNAQIVSSAEAESWDKKIDSILHVLQGSNEDIGKANTIFELGLLYDKKDNYDEVLKLGDQLLMLSQRLNYKDGTGFAYLLISKYHHKRKQYDLAFKNINVAIELLKHAGNKNGIAKCYKHIFTLYANQGYSDLGNKYLDSAILVWHELGMKKEEADLYILKGALCTYLGENGVALESNYYALDIYEKLNDRSGIASALGSIGFAYFGSNDDSLADKYIMEASELYKKENDKFGYANNIMTMGDLNLKQRKHTDAMKFYNEGFEIFHLPGVTKTGIPWSYNCFGRVYSSIGDSAMTEGDVRTAKKNYKEALSYFSLSLKDYLVLNLIWAAAEVKILIGEVEYKLKNYILAKKYLQDGLKGFKNVEDNESKAEAYLYLSKIDSVEGNLISAYKNFKLYNFYIQRSYNTNTSKKVEVYKARDRMQQKEKEIELLESENLLKTTLAERQKQKKIFAYGIIAFVVLAGCYGFYRYRRFSRNKSEKKLLRDRLQISQDLHDHVGSTLSSISVFSKVAQKKGEQNNKEELQAVLSRISDTSGEMVSDMNDIVWAINPKNDSMEQIIQRMESFAKPMLAVRNIRFTLDYDPSILELNLDMEKRKNLYLIFKEAINNAFKYSGCSAIYTALNNSDHQLKLYVKDNGVGFDVNRELSGGKFSLSGNGLRNMNSRAEEMKGKLQVESILDEGSEIRLRFPIP